MGVWLHFVGVAVPSIVAAQVRAPEANATPPAPQTGSYVHELAPRVGAARANEPIDIDGQLDEAVWSQAIPITDFIQELPIEGQPGTQRTEVRIAYDDDAVYVGAMLYDSGELTGRMSRRDAGSGDFDFLAVSFDSFHDHQTSYRFSVNLSGSFGDAFAGGVAGGGGGGGGRGGGGGAGDTSWDPVWTRATQVTDEGWSAEFRIPFSQLRFNPGDAQVWGIRVERHIHRSQERTVFPFIPTLETGGASRYAHLDGIGGIQAGQRLELLPYVTARGEYLHFAGAAGNTFSNPYRTGSDEFGDAGIDLKYRLTSNVTLDATVNPDFGQVELDPSVINLTDFETRYEERRPFFVEGADIFTFGEGGPGGSTGRPPEPLYTRRLGRAPQGSVPSSAVFSDVATTTTILGAAKVTGRTSGGWSLGVLNALTAEETARYSDVDEVRSEAVVEPMTNYFVGRLRRQFRGGETRFGMIATAVHRSLDDTGMDEVLHSAAYSGGVDFAHEWSNRTYRFSSMLVASHVEGSAAAVLRTQRSSSRYFQRPDAWNLDLDPAATSLGGYFAFADFNKQAGALTTKVAVSLSSPGLEVNDMGFQSAADRIVLDTNMQYSQPVPGRVLRNWSLRWGPDASWNYAGDRIHGEANGNFNFQFLNYWGVGTRLAFTLSNDDDRLTRGGPIATTPQRWSGTVNLNSDSRRSVVGGLTYDWANDEAGGWRQDLSLNLSASPNEILRVELSPSLARRLETAQYVTAVSDELATATYGERYLFADLDQTTFSVATRVDFTLSPAVSFQLYVEPFISTGDYQTLKEFARRRDFEFLQYGDDVGTLSQAPSGPYTVDPDGAGPAVAFNVTNRDFSRRSLIGNAVLRWEWRQGSTLYLVWQQQRIDSLTNRGPTGTDEWVGEFDLSRDVADMFDARADNVFAVKVSYWLNP